MSLVLLRAAQAAQGAAPPQQAPQGVIPLDFDLAEARPVRGEEGCGGGSPGDILVCGVRRSGAGAYPFAAMARLFAPRPIRAEANLGGGATGRAFVEQKELDRGAVSNRIMFGITWPF